MTAVDLTDATARVKYGNSELSVVGQGKLDGSSVDVTWREMFAAKAAFRRRYDVKGTVPSGLVPVVPATQARSPTTTARE